MHPAPKVIENERVILLELREGNEAAFEKIYRAYSPRIYASIYKMVKSQDDAHELLQDVFSKVWEKRAKIDPDQSFGAYLFQISKYAVYNFIRKCNYDKILKNYLCRFDSELYSHVEENLIGKQQEQFLEDIISQLPTQRQLIYRMCKLQGKTYAEVAEHLGISVSTISDHIVKATRFIREKHASIEGTLAIAMVALICRGL